MHPPLAKHLPLYSLLVACTPLTTFDGLEEFILPNSLYDCVLLDDQVLMHIVVLGVIAINLFIGKVV